MDRIYVPGIGKPYSKLAIIGIAPSHEEEKKKEPFVGPAGSILKRDLAEAGVDIRDTYRTNIFKYKLPDNEFERHKELGLSLPDAIADLKEELNVLNPNCILGLGDPVLYSLAGKSGKYNHIGVWRGSILNCLTYKTIFTWHPAAELHGESNEKGQWRSWQKYVRKFDVARAVEQSKFREFRLPQRLLHVARSSADVYRYFEKNKNEKYCALDIEAIEGIPVCLGFSFKHHEGFSIPLWNLLPIKCVNQAHPKKSYSYDLKVSTIPTPDLAYIWKLIAQKLLDNNTNYIGQNFKYDEDKINALGLYLWKLFWDTQIGAHCVSSEMPKNLAFQTSINTEEPYYKFEGREFVPGRDKIEDLLLYNCKDACVTREIFDCQMRDLKEIPYGMEHATWRMQLHKAYLDIDRVGFKIDENERRHQIHKYVGKLVEKELELFNLCKPFGVEKPINVRSNPQVHTLLYETLKIPLRKGAGEQVLTSLIGNVLKDDNLVKICEAILEIRRIDKTIDYLKAEPDYDGRMKSNTLITGTENFRTSDNVLEPPVRQEKKGWALKTVTKHGDIGHDLRSILIADPGYVVVNIDQSQAESRVCSLLADDEQTLREYDTIDKHASTASKFFGGTEQSYSKRVLGYECAERFVGKTMRHAYHLDIGKHEAMINVNTDARKYKIPIRISEWRASECLKILALDTPKIKSVFHDSIQRLLRDDRRLFGTYNASRYFYDEMDTRDLWKGAYSFIPQQTVSDKTKQVILKVLKNLWDVRIAAESHDALVFLIRECVLNERIEEIKSYFLEPIDFSRCSIPRRNLVIPCDVEIGIDYCDLRKYQLKRAA